LRWEEYSVYKFTSRRLGQSRRGKRKSGSPRKGILGLDTTRGDRLFVSLLGSAFIHLAWLGLTDMTLWIATVISVIYAIIVFRYV
jgi:predicted small integral membrane protein